MNIKNPLIFFLTFTITLIILVPVFQSLFGKSPSEIKNILEKNEYNLRGDIKIFNPVNDELDKKIIHTLNQTKNKMTKILGYIEFTEGLNVIIFNEIEDLQEYSDLDNVGAFYYGKYNLISIVKPDSLEREADLWFFKRDLSHEYTHYYLDKYLHEKSTTSIPKWFDEGLAEYVSVTLDNVEVSDSIEDVINFENLNTREDWVNYRKESNQLYLQSHYGVKYIIDNNGIEVIKKIIDQSKSIGFLKSFKDNTGLDVSELHMYIE
ncbi:peptidase MA family metallohydrolase [Metabacillus litoralis]|uniref:peptidase MA family metallohydrolase n=1 Tax=Metabacillus litoralis TaxID=152268 RepID=UPI001CFE8575|nr:hypothetical protein [Metabacillus litoralis]